MSKEHEKKCKGGEDCSDEKHMCKVAGRKDPELIRSLVKDARYFCRKCGRAAHDSFNLCKPLAIE